MRLWTAGAIVIVGCAEPPTAEIYSTLDTSPSQMYPTDDSFLVCGYQATDVLEYRADQPAGSPIAGRIVASCDARHGWVGWSFGGFPTYGAGRRRPDGVVESVEGGEFPVGLVAAEDGLYWITTTPQIGTTLNAWRLGSGPEPIAVLPGDAWAPVALETGILIDALATGSFETDFTFRLRGYRLSDGRIETYAEAPLSDAYFGTYSPLEFLGVDAGRLFYARLEADADLDTVEIEIREVDLATGTDQTRGTISGPARLYLGESNTRLSARFFVQSDRLILGEYRFRGTTAERFLAPPPMALTVVGEDVYFVGEGYPPEILRYPFDGDPLLTTSIDVPPFL